MRFFCLLLACCFFAAGVFAAEVKPVSEAGLANYEATNKSTAELARKFDLYRKQYYSKLKSARTYAVRDADADEVKRIDDALSGKYVGDFTSKNALSAREFFDGKLRYLVKDYNRDLESIVKKLLTDGNTEDAIFIKDTISFLEAYSAEDKKVESSGSRNRKKISVEADKDWQDTGVTFKPGTVVNLSVSGRWAPGAVNKKNKVDTADADTYNLQIKVGAFSAQGGTKWKEFSVPTEGDLSARMLPFHRGARSEARGSVTMYLEWQEPSIDSSAATAVSASKPLETVIAEIIDPKASATAVGAVKQESTEKTQSYKFYLKADEDWQDSGVSVKKGQKVSIVADGEWTPNKDKRPKQSADVYRYAVKIDRSTQTIGGKTTEFISNTNGKLEMRSTFYPNAKEKNRTPDGSLKMTITVSSE